MQIVALSLQLNENKGFSSHSYTSGDVAGMFSVANGVKELMWSDSICAVGSELLILE